MATPIMADLALKISANTAELKKGLGKANNQISKFNKNVTKQNNKLVKGFKSLGKVVAGAFAIREAGRFTLEAAKMAAQVQGVYQAFNRMKDSKKILDDLREATRGTQSDLELMQRAIKADNFKIPMDTLAKGLDFATKRASQTGESIDYLVDSFVTGLGRESVKILDNLGISALELSREVEKVGNFAQAVNNIVDRELTKMGEVILSDAQKMEIFNANIQNAKASFGELALKGMMPFVEMGNKMFATSDRIANSLSNEKDKINETILSITGYTEGSKERKRALDKLKSDYPAYFGNLDSEKVKNEDLLSALESVNREYANRIVIANYEKDLAKLQNTEDKLEKKRLRGIQHLQNFATQYNYTGLTVDELTEKVKKFIKHQEEGDPTRRASKGELSGYKQGLNALEEYPKKYDVILNKQEALKGKRDELLELLGQEEHELGVIAETTTTTTEEVEKQNKLRTDLTAIQDQIKGASMEELVNLYKQEDSLKRQIADMEHKAKLAAGLISPEAIKFEADASGIDVGAADIDTTHLVKMKEAEEYTQEEIARMKDEYRQAEVIKNAAGVANWIDTVSQGLEAIANINEAAKQRELSAAGDNEAKREAIEKKYRKKQQRMAIAQALINGALAVTNMIANVPMSVLNPATWVGVGIAGASTLAQVAAISAQNFADGGLVYGETLARVGEYSGAGSNPEVIAPLNKLQNILSNTMGGGKLVAVVTGDQLAFILSEHERKQDNTF